MKNFLKSFVYAFKGIYTVLKDQRNFKIQLLIAVGVVVLGLYFNITQIEWYVILLTIGVVLSLELMNSAVEDLVNLITREHHPLAGKIKDVAAGAVLIFSIVAAIIGTIIFAKYIS